MIGLLVKWVKKNSLLLFNTGSLIGAMLVTSLSGFAYWWVAARYFSTEAVGLASAATSALMLISTFCLLGLGTLLITEIPRNVGKAGPLICTALLAVGIVGFVVGGGVALLTPFISPSLQPIGDDIPNIAFFAFSIAIASVTSVVDQVTIALLKGSLQFWRNVIFSLAKLVLLYIVGRWFSDETGMTIYATWTLGTILSLLPLLALALWKNRRQMSNFLPQQSLLRKLGASAMQHHILNLIIQAPTRMLPVLATVLLSDSMTAWFYIALMIANFLFSITLSLTTVLHATNAAERSTLGQKARLTISLGAFTSAVTCVILVIGAHPILSFFGHSYAEQAAWPLRLLSLGAFPLIIKNHYIAIRRIKDEITNAMLPIAFGSILELILAAAGAYRGALIGLSLGWIIALSFEAIIMTPYVFKNVVGKVAAEDTIESIVDMNTMIMVAVRPGLVSDALNVSLDQIIDAPTIELEAIRGLTQPLRAIRNPIIVDTPTIKLESADFDEDATIKLPRISVGNKAHKRTKASVNHSKHNGAETPVPSQPPELLPVNVPDLKDESLPSITEIHQN
ncbi:MAG TPA: oligosaccharide flippase family protein [Ktedonobacteraceae bacterium]|nr:oligosaccharide flippase family protein [Ktedonobacteraceae bacterium]